MTPTEALRRARATMECLEDVWINSPDTHCLPGCSWPQHPLSFSATWADWSHREVASALLDGYSIAEITKAGG